MALISRTAPMVPRDKQHAGSHVLVAEDDAEMRRILLRVLAKEGYRLTAVSSGPELARAFESMHERGTYPDLIVSDVRMPGLSAFEFLAQADVPSLAVPVILITAFCDDATLQRATQLGASCVLSKPFDMDVLRSAVLCVLAGASDMR